jgi:peptidoglycan/xylan/chitin deacetylase (PgdA/CDA1 family)
MMNAALLPLLHRRRLRCVLWSVQPEGARPVAADVQTDRVVARAHAGAIVDLHDAEGTPSAPERLVTALPAMIDRLLDAGYGFATVSDLLG